MATREHSTTAPESATAQPFNIKIGRRALFAGALTAPLIAAAPHVQAAPTSLELERICAEAVAAEDHVGAWLWVEDEPKQREIGRSPTDADIRTLEAAHSRREEAVNALYSFEPTSIGELWRKAQAMQPHALCEEDVALDVLIGDLARMAGAAI